MRTQGRWTPTTKRGFTLFWATLFAMSLLLQFSGIAFAGSLSGAVYTSNADGTVVNENIYASRGDVYLTGGPCTGGSALPDGTYYFQVTDPSGQTLLSTDAIGNREFTISGGFITSTTGTHVITALACLTASGITIQLMPYDPSPNNGSEYKLTVASAASVALCAGFDPLSATFQICSQASQKSDNFKVGSGSGSIKIVKNVSGDPSNWAGGQFGFDIVCGSGSSATTTSVFVTLAAGVTSGSITVPGFVDGASCTVTETGIPSAGPNYKWGLVTYEGTPASVVTGTTQTVTVTNERLHPGLTIVKSTTDGPYSKVGDVIHYTIVATNSGNTTLENVVVTDANVTDLICTPSGLTLAPGAAITCTASHTITQADINAGFFNNQACVGATGLAATCSDVRVVGTQTPNIAIVKTANPTSLPVSGGSVTYTYVVTNPGNMPFSGVTLSDLITGTTTIACSPTGPVMTGGNQDAFLDPGETWTYSCTTTITRTTSNTATVTGTYGDSQHKSAQDDALVTVITPAPTATPIAIVAGITSTQQPALPPTDSLGGTGSSSTGSNFGLFLVLLAGLMTAMGLLVPVRGTNRRDRRG